MLKFSINIGMLFPELAFTDRFEACTLAGFKYIEFPFPYAFDPFLLKDKMHKSKLELVLFDLPVDDWDIGGRGCAANPYAIDTFRDGVETAIRYSSILCPKYLTCLVGNRLPGVPYSTQRKTLVDNLRYASEKLSPMGIDLLVEIFNTHDSPDFFITRVTDALSLMDEVDRPNFKIQIDTYHVHQMEGDLGSVNKENIDHIGHIQISDLPGRHQPGTGEIDFTFFLGELDRLEYPRYVGLEYIPLGSTQKSLDWIKKYKLDFVE